MLSSLRSAAPAPPPTHTHTCRRVSAVCAKQGGLQGRGLRGGVASSPLGSPRGKSTRGAREPPPPRGCALGGWHLGGATVREHLVALCRAAPPPRSILGGGRWCQHSTQALASLQQWCPDKACSWGRTCGVAVPNLPLPSPCPAHPSGLGLRPGLSRPSDRRPLPCTALGDPGPRH